MFFSIDIGNSHTAYGVFRKNKLIHAFHTSTRKLSEYEPLKKFIKESFELLKIKISDIEAVGFSSVVPPVDNLYKETIKEIFHKKPFIVTPDIKLPFKLLVDIPQQVGADRICNVAAAYKKYGGPLVIVDFGTATNYDVISKKGDFLGGIISPGIKISANALSAAAAKLPEVELVFPDKIIGTNTIDNMQSGIMYGALFAMEGFIKKIKKELGPETKVLAAGGFSKLMYKKTSLIDNIETNLVLYGVKYLYEYNKKKAGKS